MTPHDFFPKLADFSDRRSHSGAGLLPLGVGAASLFALTWLLRRFAPTPHAVTIAVALCVLAALLFTLARRNNAFTEHAQAAKPIAQATASNSPIDMSKTEAAVVTLWQHSTPLNRVGKSDEAWAAAVISYEAAMRRLAVGEPGSRSEAQTRALELARLQGLLIRASQPHLPLGLEFENGITTDIL